ncbi:hypothetical protein BX616_008017 [Lobosporangium transversale]|uniref:Uncharacterized protein n=1 Tax=Lobosporangium transversale TaxID=64571 RepID=A0A1Y2GA84_9FUNG|nr:hypothetical protein BCR41DRAFT_425640 [Lobosporangium transversale]KAF9914572.1 hypothetical protein BX616_008017 [Lobosporangium transversale]ORZ05180.1 hypothetical protein BCR41DRAFT_425640 [Lobosporangium transversale]|eukprot:XP_021876955.1 hypothetical protein BCR41DRAFT_425640 [Lobosporangium transversale]
MMVMGHVQPLRSSFHSKTDPFHGHSHLSHQEQYVERTQGKMIRGDLLADAHSHQTTHSENDGEDDVNFHDYIHSKNDDDKEADNTHFVSLPLPQNMSTNDVTDMDSSRDNHLNSTTNITTNESQQIPSSSDTDTHMCSVNIDHLYESTSYQFPPYDLVPPPTHDLFRTLMEELQTQAAIQRDQFMAPSTRLDSSESNTDSTHHGHHVRSVPRFMMEPLDFLSSTYESCLDPDLNHTNESTMSSTQTQHSYQESPQPTELNQATSDMVSLSTPHSSGAGTNMSDAVKELDTVNPKKRPLSDEPHKFETDDGSSPPHPISTSHEHLSPPTQDLFRMLMEELETQAAIQRDHDLASSNKSDISGNTMNTSEFSFHNNLHNHHYHHNRLPRFVMDPFDVFIDSTQTSENQPSVTSAPSNPEEAQETTSSILPSHDLSPPTQDLFRTLMEELETQAAFQRDQYMAETTGIPARVDPEEYVFNGQHLRPLPRFMMEPLDFLNNDFDSCLDPHATNESGSNSAYPFSSAQAATTDVTLTEVPNDTNRSVAKPSRLLPARSPRPRKHKAYKAILPQQSSSPTHEHGASQNEASEPRTEQTASSAKRRKLNNTSSPSLAPSSPASTQLASDPTVSSPEPEAKSNQESQPPADVTSDFSSSPFTDTSEGHSPDESVEGANISAKRPWTSKDEELLLKLFAMQVPIKEIAQTLKRTVHSVRSRRQILTDPGFVRGKGHGVSRRCKQDPATTTKLPTYAQMAFLSLAWLPELEGTLNDVAAMVEKLFSRHLNRIPRTGHKNLQIWRAQISDALAHEKGQPRPRFESFGLKRGRQWVYRLTDFGKHIVDAMGGVEAVCQDLLKSNEMELAASIAENTTGGPNGTSQDANGLSKSVGSGADAGIGQGQGYGYSYRPPDARQKSRKRTRPPRLSAARRKQLEELAKQEPRPKGSVSAIARAMEAMAAGLAKVVAQEEEKDRMIVKKAS